MAHYFEAGVFTSSTWHGMEEIHEMTTALELIEHGERVGAYPIDVTNDPIVACLDVDDAEGDPKYLEAPQYQAIVGHYAGKRRPKVLGVVGGRYRATLPEEWRELILAAGKAGAKPTGCFALNNGSRVVATFEVSDESGIVTHLVLADAFDGSMKLSCGFTSIRTVCANTLSAAMSQDGKAWAGIRHTASLEEKISKLAEAIEAAVEHGHAVAKAFDEASNVQLQRDKAIEAFDALFPPAPEDASQRAKTRAENMRDEARAAATMSINKVGNKPGNLGTLWNAATYLVDRRADGERRDARGGAGNSVSSMLFGSRAKRLQEISKVVEVVMRDGSVEKMTPAEAVEAGVDEGSIGRKLVADMLDN